MCLTPVSLDDSQFLTPLELPRLSSAPRLQLLLFTDERPAHRAEIRKVQDYLYELQTETEFYLRQVDIKDEPHLVEYFRLVATPALVKIFPEPKQVIAGSDLLTQLKRWWNQWLDGLIELQEQEEVNGDRPQSDVQNQAELDNSPSQNELHSAEIMRLSDNVFYLRREKEDLIKQLEYKDQILAMLAHDLRSPLTGASIAVETIESIEKRPSTPEMTLLKDKLFRQAKNQLKTMNQMITELLHASRQLSAKLDVSPKPLSLYRLCQQIVEEIQERYLQKSLQLLIDIPRDLPEVYGDRELIRQLIVNLLDNALKYTPNGGKVRLVGLHRTAQKVQMSVVDTGYGIPDDEQEKIFQGHFRLKRDEQLEGYGLGLALCRRIVHAHHGRIWVESTVGQGSEFHFTLPVYR